MYYACKFGSFEAFRALVECKCDMEMLDANKETAIFYAFSYIKTDFIRKVLPLYKINLNLKDSYNKFALS